MKKEFCFTLIAVFLMVPLMDTAKASLYPDPQMNTNKGIVPQGRTDAAVVLHYDPYAGISSNRLYVYGGKGKDLEENEIFLDPDGRLHSVRFATLATISVWDTVRVDQFPLYEAGDTQLQSRYIPEGRFAHSALIVPTISGGIVNWLDELALRETEWINLVVFGGKKQVDVNEQGIHNNTEVTDELYVCAQYGISLETREERFHWYRIEPDPEAVWPSARYHAQMVPLFADGTEIIDGEYPFLLFGGLDANNTILDDAYIGIFRRELIPAPGEDNEWEFTMNITVEFTSISSEDWFEVSGAGVVFDPFYGASPRVIVAGGRRFNYASGEPAYIADTVITLSESPIHGWTNPIYDTLPDLPAGVSTSSDRVNPAVVFNPRDHRLRVIGGEDIDGNKNPGILDLDLRDSQNQWVIQNETCNIDNPKGVYSNGTRIFSSYNQQGVIYWDRTEATRERPSEPYIWEVHPGSDYGLNSLNTIMNTPRLHAYDVIRIHQTRSEEGKVNDAYLTNAVVPTWCRDITLEGVVQNGVKPVLYNLYSEENTQPNLIKHWRDQGKIMYCAGAMTIRNITFCHSQDELQHDDPFPSEIPGNVLEKYTGIQESGPGTDLWALLARYYDRDDDVWDLARHHTHDMGLYVHTPFYIENCDFRLNGIGITLVCVSSAVQQAKIQNNEFRDNFMGVLALELHHDISRNTFDGNYLAGVVFDKGSRAICRENLFINNGRFSGEHAMVAFQGALLTHFCTTSYVPDIMTPVIYNNTLVDNYRALSVTECEYRRQFMNRPYFFNNIISGSTEPILLKNGDDRCDFISYNNCFPDDGAMAAVETDAGGIVMGWSLYEDPGFVENNPIPYVLSSASPCLDNGLHTLDPGVISELNYKDYGMLTMGFHQLPGEGTLPGSPVDLQIDGYELSWDESTPYPDGYLVCVESVYGYYIYVGFIEDTSFEFTTLATNNDHLYFWVLSHIGRRVYSDPVMIEWIEE
jgi:hypothetical protein